MVQKRAARPTQTINSILPLFSPLSTDTLVFTSKFVLKSPRGSANIGLTALDSQYSSKVEAPLTAKEREAHRGKFVCPQSSAMSSDIEAGTLMGMNGVYFRNSQ